MAVRLIIAVKGGPGSGFHNPGHCGIEGERGGSQHCDAAAKPKVSKKPAKVDDLEQRRAQAVADYNAKHPLPGDKPTASPKANENQPAKPANQPRKAVLRQGLTAYHITLKENADAIDKQGLRPTSEVGVNPLLSGTIEGYDVDGVFLANAGQMEALAAQMDDEGIDYQIYEAYVGKGHTVYEDDLMPEGSLIVPGGISARQLRRVTLDDIKKDAQWTQVTDYSKLFDEQAAREAKKIKPEAKPVAKPKVVIKTPKPKDRYAEMAPKTNPPKADIDAFVAGKGPQEQYHVTSIDNLESILDKGLVPAFKPAPGQSWEAVHAKYATYFHNAYTEAALRDMQDTNAFDPDNPGFCIIKFKIPRDAETARRILPDEDSGAKPNEGLHEFLTGLSGAVVGGVPAAWITGVVLPREAHPYYEQAVQMAGKHVKLVRTHGQHQVH